MIEFKGSYVALVTPFKGGKFDAAAYRDLIEFQIANGTAGIVPCGTTGESATLTHAEHREVIEACIEAVGGRVQVVAGTGSNSTAESIALTKEAEASGADAALLITPYYNKPQQQGLFDHYRAIAESTKLPLVVYNCPGRTGVSISPETLARLDAIANVAAVKDATGDPDWTTEVALSTKLTIVSGDDARTLALMAIGATGVISVSANIAPRMVADQCRAASEGRWDEARRLHLELYRLTKLLFVESNPAPIKAAVEMMGKIGPEIRPPLSTLSALNRDRLRAEMARMKLIAA